MRRPLPEVSPETAPFWRGGEVGELRLPRCVRCQTVLHPAHSTCPACLSTEVEHVAIGGTGVVQGVSVNQQQWLPDMAPPYVVAFVALDDAPGVRLTTNIVDVEPEAVHIGMAVEVTFEHQDDVWFPLFRPSGAPDRNGLVEEPQVVVRPPASAERFEHRIAITGVGMSEVGRRLMRSPRSLMVEASLAAIADAGLDLSDIDGISTYPGAGLGLGMTEGGVMAIDQALGIHPTWHNGGAELPGQGGAVVAGMLAVAAGLCRHVLCIRTVWEATYAELGRRGQGPEGGGRAPGDMAWKIPFGATSASTWIGMAADQYFARYGGGRELLGRIAVNARTMAGRNPTAIYREPITMDDYYAARMISTPFGLYDCDVPCDASVAVIVSAVDAADDTRAPIHCDAVGTQITETYSWDQGTVTHEPLTLGAAAHLWTRASVTRNDVDLALLYDGFTFNCVSWIEALGFCGLGEAADFVGDGSPIALGGRLPLNPHGGQLSAGRTHGFGFIHEAVTQLRGAAGDRQVADAEVAVVTTGGGSPGGCFLLTTPR